MKLGETALAFYSAENPTDEPIIGISTYSIEPYAAAVYFNKIQVRIQWAYIKVSIVQMAIHVF